MWAVFVIVYIFWHSWLYFGQGLKRMVLRTPAVMLPKFCKIIVVFLDLYLDGCLYSARGCVWLLYLDRTSGSRVLGIRGRDNGSQ